MRERLVIIGVAVVLGLIITVVVFFVYQNTRKGVDIDTRDRSNIASPTPQEEDKIFLKISEPQNEIIVDRRTIQIKGSTNPENTIIISTNQEDTVGIPSSEGKFSITIEISTGSNAIIIRSIAPDGEAFQLERTITFSTEEF